MLYEIRKSSLKDKLAAQEKEELKAAKAEAKVEAKVEDKQRKKRK